MTVLIRTRDGALLREIRDVHAVTGEGGRVRVSYQPLTHWTYLAWIYVDLSRQGLEVVA